MQEKSTAFSHEAFYVPNKRELFLWWLATAEKDLLKNCTVDRNRYAIVGMSVLGTWAFACLAWSYFFSTVLGNWFIACVLGLFMGGIILSIDRALIKGIHAGNKRKFLPLFFRGVLALLIGLFMAQPALLFLFDKEIHLQASIDNEVRKKEKRKQQDAVYYGERAALLSQKKNIEQQLGNQYKLVTDARSLFISETDGTGGSKKIGLKDIALAKQNAYLKLDADYQASSNFLLPQLKRIDSILTSISAGIEQEQVLFNGLLNDGFITRIEALNHLVANNRAVAFRYYLLVALLLLIELMPVIAKLILPEGSYDLNVQLKELLEKDLTQMTTK
jgi:Domain of unknown function (DUF4407)